MSAATLLRTLHAQDAHLTVSNGELTIDAPEDFFSATMLQTLTAHKPALVALLTRLYPPAPCLHTYSTISDGVWVCQRCQNTVRRAGPAPPAAADLPPCAVCGCDDRWDDAGVWRCVACETAPISERLRALAHRDGDRQVLTAWQDRYPPLAALTKARPFLGCFHAFITEGRRATCGKCGYTCPIIPAEAEAQP